MPAWVWRDARSRSFLSFSPATILSLAHGQHDYHNHELVYAGASPNNSVSNISATDSQRYHHYDSHVADVEDTPGHEHTPEDTPDHTDHVHFITAAVPTNGSNAFSTEINACLAAPAPSAMSARSTIRGPPTQTPATTPSAAAPPGQPMHRQYEVESPSPVFTPVHTDPLPLLWPASPPRAQCGRDSPSAFRIEFSLPTSSDVTCSAAHMHATTNKDSRPEPQDREWLPPAFAIHFVDPAEASAGQRASNITHPFHSAETYMDAEGDMADLRAACWQAEQELRGGMHEYEAGVSDADDGYAVHRADRGLDGC